LKYFSLSLLITHPKMDPEIISKELGLVPKSFWKVGEQRKTPKGDILDGRYKESKWSHWSDYKSKDSDYTISKTLDEYIDYLRPHKLLFRKIVREGGDSQIILRFPGDKNNGDTINYNTLKILCELNINFGVEVFPEWKINRLCRLTTGWS